MSLVRFLPAAVLIIIVGCQRPTTPTSTASRGTPAPNEVDVTSTVTKSLPVEVEENPVEEEKPAVAAEDKPAEPPPEVAGLQPFAKDYEVWLDKQAKRVLVGGRIVRTEGQLEMFACLKNSKEHESIVAVNTKAVNVNAALMVLGALPGSPVQFRPEFKPATGPEVEVTVIWTNKAGKREQVRAQEWIRDLKSGKALSQPWVFGGSGFWKDDDGKEYFMAEEGDFICISNFTSAMLDLPVESSQATADLQFEAFTERIPPVGTPVLLVLTPKLKAEDNPKTKNE